MSEPCSDITAPMNLLTLPHHSLSQHGLVVYQLELDDARVEDVAAVEQGSARCARAGPAAAAGARGRRRVLRVLRALHRGVGRGGGSRGALNELLQARDQLGYRLEGQGRGVGLR